MSEPLQDPPDYETLRRLFIKVVLQATIVPKSLTYKAPLGSILAQGLRHLATWQIVTIEYDNLRGLTATLVTKP